MKNYKEIRFLREELDTNMDLIKDVIASIIMKRNEVDRLTDKLFGLEIDDEQVGINVEICDLEKKIMNDNVYLNDLNKRHNAIIDKINLL